MTETHPAEQSPASIPKIVVRSGPLRGNVLGLEKDRVSMGRDPRNDISIADGIISSFHASIVRDGDGSYWLEDLGSKNGTFLHGDRVEREPLRDGDVFYLCQNGPELQFILGEPKLPGILESSTATFARTKSISRAIRELLPHGKTSLGALLQLTGVRKILDYRLEEATRRARWGFLALTVSFLGVALMVLAGTIWIQLRDRGVSSPTATSAATSGGVVASAIHLDVTLQPIYGSLFLTYRQSPTPLGRVQIKNGGDKALGPCVLDLRFESGGEDFLVEPCLVGVSEIPAGESREVSLAPKLSAAVLSDQTREVKAHVSLQSGNNLLAEVYRAVFVYGRHVFNWEEAARVAVFVDTEDPAVVQFVHAIWAQRPRTSRQEFPPANVVGALTLLTGLSEMGIRYLPDATSPVSALIDGKANDSVKYPWETLLARAGDCDDLTVLCCSILERAGISAALAVGSGHVLFLFDTGISAGTLAQTPLDPSTVVVREDRVWMPVESTDFARPGANFASAWSAAWVRCKGIESGEMQFVELREAWRKYHPMNPPLEPWVRERVQATRWPGDGVETSIAFGLSSLRKLFEENLGAKMAEIERDLEGLQREHEKGLLLARSGLFDEARRVLEKAIFGDEEPSTDAGRLESRAPVLGEYAPVLLTDLAICIVLGARGPGDLDLAVRYFEAGLASLPEPAVRDRGELMLRLALVKRLRGDLPAARSWSEKAFELDPSLQVTYRDLIASEATVAGADEKTLDYLRKGLR